ncbi:ankyrin repeat-containing domain protein [Favolaschia claudopus]|uniref:Ankyrin repeat-containing domain protein n=1 Tax=Favolaschia claudopus TaxID=2862362 RepID=A0AAW0BG45_9AGAR
MPSILLAHASHQLAFRPLATLDELSFQFWLRAPPEYSDASPHRPRHSSVDKSAPHQPNFFDGFTVRVNSTHSDMAPNCWSECIDAYLPSTPPDSSERSRSPHHSGACLQLRSARAVNESNALTLTKFLSPPYSVDPGKDASYPHPTLLPIAASLGDVEMMQLLLDAGANPDVEHCSSAGGWQSQPIDSIIDLYNSEGGFDLEMLKLLLDYGADANTLWLRVCFVGDLNAMKLLYEHGADIEYTYSNTPGLTPLHAAATGRNFPAVKYLLEQGADVTVIMEWGPPPWFRLDLLFRAMKLRCWKYTGFPRRYYNDIKWEGLPMDAETKGLMAILLAYGISKEVTMETIREHFPLLISEADNTEEEFLATVTKMIEEAEEAIPLVMGTYVRPLDADQSSFVEALTSLSASNRRH